MYKKFMMQTIEFRELNGLSSLNSHSLTRSTYALKIRSGRSTIVTTA